MPRFLDTSTGDFCWVADPSTVTYAILSHTWRSEAEGGEQTYDEVRKLWKRMRKAGLSGKPFTTILHHPDLSEKIKGICKVAREAGYKLIWIDSVCIDKSSSAELAEAINSMFGLYRLSDVCYVYLADVHEQQVGSGRYETEFQFHQSRWHTRGWTLQELLAPKEVVFFTASWTLLGTKFSLMDTLQSRTGIDCDILLGRAPLDSVSVARRMSWAAGRNTTRVEDEAYSLLGIFGVHLSPIYGEGRNAFLRLQEEIMKTIPDQSIFAWGELCSMPSIDEVYPLSRDPGLHYDAPTGLLASSPREFLSARDIRPLSSSDYLSFVAGDTRSGEMVSTAPSLHSVVTPEGIRLKALTVDLTELPQIAAAMVAIPRWPDRNNNRLSPDDHDSSYIRLAPYCEDKLRTLGFKIAPLECRWMPHLDMMVTETSIFRLKAFQSTEFPHSKSDSARREEPGIRITLSIRARVPGASREQGTMNMTALGRLWDSQAWEDRPDQNVSIRFDFSSFVHKPFRATHKAVDISRHPCVYCRRIGECQITETLSLYHYHGKGTHTLNIPDSTALSDRTIAQTHFIVPHPIQHHLTENELATESQPAWRTVRILKLAIVCPVELSDQAVRNRLAPSLVELSLLHYAPSSVPALYPQHVLRYRTAALWPRTQQADCSLSPGFADKPRALGLTISPVNFHWDESEWGMVMRTWIFPPAFLTKHTSEDFRRHVRFSLKLSEDALPGWKPWVREHLLESEVRLWVSTGSNFYTWSSNKDVGDREFLVSYSLETAMISAGRHFAK
ncbi:Vegetative incompatibility protein HET-E-1 [Trametes pubescens]|uniref:Vegetative incompatibility protein HET-E-1 n=1 Tax=Trametes pubescens TaxID=154538 RepID=A0A1M2W4L1_TRAPU|nr:Vegetative incompatibility protein HET-E-1 [Trametes pubescens]